jgi:hypothetical protein
MAMGFLKKIFERNKLPSLPPETELMFDFEDQYGKQTEKLLEKAERAEPDYNAKANSKVSGYQKAISAMGELKTLCESKGEGGVLYYKKNYADYENSLKSDLKSYLNNEYEEDKKSEKEYADQLKHSKRIESKILQLINVPDGILQKDVVSQFASEDKSTVIRIISGLIRAGKLSKEKHGSFNFLKVMK